MKKVFNIAWYIITIIISIICIVYGTIFEKKEYTFKQNAKCVNAYVYQKVDRNDGKHVLYFYYRVNGKKYEDLVVLKENLKDNSYIKLYYDKDNPKRFTTGNIAKKGYIFIILGSLVIIVDVMLVLSSKQKKKEYNNAI